MPKCPACNGAKKSMCFVDGRDAQGRAWGDVREVACLTCKGSGEVSEDHLVRMEHGKAMRDERVRHGITLMAAARARGISPAQLSSMERGDGPPEAYN